MPTGLIQFENNIARLVTADTLVPCQRPTSTGLKIACDFHQQVMLKHPFLSDFHSKAEHLYAGLFEGDNKILSYVPQPFLLRIRGRYYTPDGYVVFNDGTRWVFELKPRGEWSEDKLIPLKHFFAQHNMIFEVVSNESVFERRIEAENWLEIVRILHMAKDYDTQVAQDNLMERFYQCETCTLGDVVDAGDRERTYLMEIALFQLMHRGQINAELTKRWLDYDTRLSLCH